MASVASVDLNIIASIHAPLPERGLYAITPESAAGGATLLEQVRQAIAGGAVMVQYRAKVRAAVAEARRLQQLCAEHNVPLIINDDPEIARAVGAAGVHLGRDDISVTQARQILGSRAIIGVSCYNRMDRLRSAADAGADYAALGCFFPSPTKPGAARATPEFLRQARAESRLPVVAIGGITPENGGVLIAAGAHWLAASNGVFASGDIAAAARQYRALFHWPPSKGNA